MSPVPYILFSYSETFSGVHRSCTTQSWYVTTFWLFFLCKKIKQMWWFLNRGIFCSQIWELWSPRSMFWQPNNMKNIVLVFQNEIWLMPPHIVRETSPACSPVESTEKGWSHTLKSFVMKEKFGLHLCVCVCVCVCVYCTVLWKGF
jgi:hypothetical protein